MSLGLVLLLLPGCTNLNEKWYSETTPSTYFTSKESIYSFLARPYTHWRWYQEFDRAIMQECSTDEMCVTQKGIHYNDVRYAQLQHHSWTPIHPNNQETWRGTGQGIAFALATKESLLPEGTRLLWGNANLHHLYNNRGSTLHGQGNL